jgi:hypothetical protein
VTAYLCEFAQSDGFGGFVRLHIAEERAWYWTYLVNVPDVDGIVAVRDHDVPLPRAGLEVRTDGLWAELWCETPNEHWTFGLEAFGLRLDEPDEALRPGGEIGERIAVGLDIEWELGDLVHGDVLVGREAYSFDGWGRFVENHSLADDVIEGDAVARVLIPLENGATVERTLVRSGAGALRWSQHVVT